MGLAIIFVILFHVGLPREDAFFGLKRMGNIGVDFFLFLSGMGLWFSWTKAPFTAKVLSSTLLTCLSYLALYGLSLLYT